MTRNRDHEKKTSRRCIVEEITTEVSAETKSEVCKTTVGYEYGPNKYNTEVIKIVRLAGNFNEMNYMRDGARYNRLQLEAYIANLQTILDTID